MFKTKLRIEHERLLKWHNTLDARFFELVVAHDTLQEKFDDLQQNHDKLREDHNKLAYQVLSLDGLVRQCKCKKTNKKKKKEEGGE